MRIQYVFEKICRIDAIATKLIMIVNNLKHYAIHQYVLSQPFFLNIWQSTPNLIFPISSKY